MIQIMKISLECETADSLQAQERDVFFQLLAGLMSSIERAMATD